MSLALPLPRALESRCGDRAQTLRLGGFRGRRVEGFSEESVADALKAHREALARGGAEVLKCDHRAQVTGVVAGGRRVVVKQVLKGGVARRLADGIRGSAGHRAWLGGHGLLARGIRAAVPLAYVEERRSAIPVASAVVLEDLRPARPADEVAPPLRDAVPELLGELVVQLHRAGASHHDLQAQHVFVARNDDGPRAGLIDLEGVRFPLRLSQEERLLALAQLNASFADAFVPERARLREFRRYARALPFRMGEKAALERIITLSRERRHHWTGASCSL